MSRACRELLREHDASSMASDAPSAMLGELACAASPTSTTRPCRHVGDTSSTAANQTSSARHRLEQGRDRLDEAIEHRSQPRRIAPCRIGRVGGAQLRVAVHAATTDAQREERPVRSQVAVPAIDVRSALDHEAPAQLAHEPRRRTTDHRLTDPRMDAVGTDDQVVVTGGAALERRMDTIGRRARGRSRARRTGSAVAAAPSARMACSSRRWSATGGATSRHSAGLIEVDERPAPLVEQPPSLHDGATLTDQAAEPQAIEGRDAVAGQEHARTRDAPRFVPLDDLARKAAQVQCARRREPRDRRHPR